MSHKKGIFYKATIQNIGDLDVTGAVVSAVAGSINSPISAESIFEDGVAGVGGTLTNLQSEDFIYVYEYTDADVAIGIVSSTATVTSSADTVSDTETVLNIGRDGKLVITKTLSDTLSPPYEVGSTISYDISVTNIGDEIAENVIVSDGMNVINAISSPPGLFGAGVDLAHDTVVIASYEYIITQADYDNGLGIMNTATASTVTPGIDDATATETIAAEDIIIPISGTSLTLTVDTNLVNDAQLEPGYSQNDNTVFHFKTRNVGTFNAQIDWGDPNDVYDPNDYSKRIWQFDSPHLRHTYQQPGIYTIKVYGQLGNIYGGNGSIFTVFSAGTENYYGSDNTKITSVVDWGTNPIDLFAAFYTNNGDTALTSLPSTITVGEYDPLPAGTTSFEETFNSCSLLTDSLSDNFFANNPDVTTFRNTFAGCTSLSGPIPGNLFAANTIATDFYNTFLTCSSLSGPIPGTLFNTNTLSEGFPSTFENCSSLSGPIPGTLFANNALATDFSDCFRACSDLGKLNGTPTYPIPGNLFANNPNVTTFERTFLACTGLSGPIPSTLFDTRNGADNIVTDFHSTFSQCSSLNGSIPGTLFSTNVAADTFSRTFQNCSSLDQLIPSNLFITNVLATSFYETFSGCSSLSGPIPGNLFATNAQVGTFQGTFKQCSSLSGPIPGTLFDTRNGADNIVTSFQSTFTQCSSLSGEIPGTLFSTNVVADTFTRTFQNCNNLGRPAIDENPTYTIPAALFTNNPLNKSFYETFFGCTGLIGPIPSTLFNTNAQVSTFQGTFKQCSSLSGPIPGTLFDTRNGADNIVTNFHSTFLGCSSLSGPIPGTLFANNVAADTFLQTFYNCTSLTGSIPGNLFATNANVSSFIATFGECSSLSGPIPGTLFDTRNGADNIVTSFESTFIGCTSLSGPIPDTLFATNALVTSFQSTFAGNTWIGLGPADIPADLFKFNTAVTHFGLWTGNGVFKDCTNLTAVPDTIFANNPNVTQFGSAFGGSTRLSTPSYNALLVNLESVNNNTGVYINTNSTPSVGPPDGEDAKATLIADHNWTIIDVPASVDDSNWEYLGMNLYTQASINTLTSPNEGLGVDDPGKIIVITGGIKEGASLTSVQIAGQTATLEQQTDEANTAGISFVAWTKITSNITTGDIVLNGTNIGHTVYGWYALYPSNTVPVKEYDILPHQIVNYAGDYLNGVPTSALTLTRSSAGGVNIWGWHCTSPAIKCIMGSAACRYEC